jgi:hypothetical protein
VTNGDDEIAASLPRPPLPSPARRRAAIDTALRRFDGAEDLPAPAVEDRRPSRLRPARPYAGALAGAFLVALIGLPFVWTSFDRYSAEERRTAGTRVERPPASPGAADPAPPSADLASPDADPAPENPSPAGEDRAAAAQRPSPPIQTPADTRTQTSDEPVADYAAEADGEVVVTGSRIRRPNLESTVPITSVGDDSISVTGSRMRRGDWNACTVDDPRRDLSACRRDVATVARGASGKAAAPLADGLSRAWEGDLEAAVEAFGRAAELAPRSAAAYLNRGLARRRLGDSGGALADLDRAVANAPQAARVYYHRSRLLRERGESRRARADEERAVELDPSYAELVRAQRRRAR